ncbi:MAG: hypothetical protein ABR577_13345 [Pyrinomonadaceae bacterium]
MTIANFIAHRSAGAKSGRRLLPAACLVLMLAAITNAQDAASANAPETAPPPMKFVSRDERSQLSAAKDLRARTRASLDLAESHLRRAEELSSAQQYDMAAYELGNYQGLIEEALHYLDGNGKDNGKTRDLYKRIELALRAHGPRIEAIRRTTPYEYSVNIKDIAKFARNARSTALNAFYGDTVMHDEQTAEMDSPADTPVKDSGTEKKAP